MAAARARPCQASGSRVSANNVRMQSTTAQSKAWRNRCMACPPTFPCPLPTLWGRCRPPAPLQDAGR
eukprot:6858795-Lingulodinium_polyedra.AAC.1